MQKENRFNKLVQMMLSMYRGGGAKRLVSLILARYLRIVYQCEIPARANIEKGVYFCNRGFGIVVNPGTSIGEGTIIQHRATFGEIEGKAPTVGKNVYIGANALILGNIQIGDNSKIGAGAVVIKDVPPGCTAVGNPSRVVNKCNN